MSLIFTRIFDFFARYRLVFFLFLGAALAVIIWLILQLRIVEDISKVLPHDEKVDQYLEVVNHSAAAEELVFFVGPADASQTIPPEELIRFAGDLADSIRGSLMPGLVAEIRDRSDDLAFKGIYTELHDNLPVFLTEEDYARLDSLTSREAVRNAVKAAYKNLVSPAGMVTRDMVLADPLGLTTLALEKRGTPGIDESYRIYDGYIFSSDLRYLIFFIKPAQKPTETSKNTALIKRLDEITGNLSRENNGEIKAGYFGTAAVSVANARQLKRDIILTMNLAIVLLVLFIGFYFGRFRVIPAIVFTTLMSAGISAAVLALIGREISGVSLGFGAVLLGIAIAYFIHYLNHLRDVREPRKVLKEIALPIVMSSIISSGDFFTLLLVRSEAVRDLGLFAGFSILAAGLLTLVFLPHLTKKINWDKSRENLVNRSVRKIASYPVEKKKLVPVMILLLTVLFYFTSKRVTFEGDLTGMSYMPPELAASESTLDRISQYSLRSVFVVTKGENIDQALEQTGRFVQKAERLREEGIVKKYTAVTGLVVPLAEQQRRLERWKAYWTEEKKAEVKETLTEAATAAGFRAGSFGRFFDWLEKEHMTVGRDDLPELSKIFIDPYISVNDKMATVTTILKVRQEDKGRLYEALQNETSSFIFDKQYLTSTFMDILNSDFNKLVIISLLIVFVVLLLSYGRIELALITFIPMFMSWIWTLGIMGLFGLKLNIFNMIITSFVFGLGIDYAIFSIQGMLQQYKYGHGDVTAYRSSVLMDAITTLIGLGVLVLAVHPALKAMAYAAIIGIISVWFVTWSMEPVLFNWLVYQKDRKRPRPVTLKDFIFSISSLSIFIIGSMFIMLYGLLFIKFLRFRTRWAKYALHYQMTAFSRVLIYSNILSSLKINKPEEEDFRKPAMVIANHQSHNDIALLLILHPKFLEMTNDRVQRNKFFGPLIKMADFYAISDGMESLLPRLRKNVEEGYSVVIFPEGTRSPDGRIQRFHKGAFYLAEELNIDLLPIIIHGSGDIYSKGEYFLKTGRAVIEVLPRITPAEARSKGNLLERSRAIRHYMTAEYRKVAGKAETPRYFRERLVKNYLFKGPVLEWYLKIKVRLEKNYALFHKYLPVDGHITDIGCGYGFMIYMMNFLSDKRTFTGIDYDAEKIEVAKNCPAMNRRIEFIAGDALTMELPKSRAFVMADVLHYFPESEQERLIIRCIENLEDGGLLIIRDGDRKMGKKHIGTRLSEFFSINLGFNKTWGSAKQLYFTSREKIVEVLMRNGMAVEVIDETKVTSNIVIIARCPHPVPPPAGGGSKGGG